MSRNLVAGLLVVLFGSAVQGWCADPPPAEAKLKALQWLAANVTEPGNPAKPDAPGAAREPSLSWLLAATPAGEGAQVRFCRLMLSPAASAEQIAMSPPCTESWIADIGPDRQVLGFKGELKNGVCCLTAALDASAAPPQIVVSENGKSVAQPWPADSTLWPAALAEWLAKTPRKKGETFTRVIFDPWDRQAGTLQGEVSGADESEVTLFLRLSFEGKEAGGFTVRLAYDGERAVLKSVLLASGRDLLSAVDATVMKGIEGRLAKQMGALAIQGRDGSDLVRKVQQLLLMPSAFDPVPEKGQGAPPPADDSAAVALENQLLQEDPAALMAACRLLMRGLFDRNIRMMLVLVARTGAPGCVEMATECYDRIGTFDRVIAGRMLAARGDARTLPTIIALLSRRDLRLRHELLAAFPIMTAAQPELKKTIGDMIVAYLDRTVMWQSNRPEDIELDQVIVMLCDYQTPKATFTLSQYFRNATPKEAGAMACVAAATKDEMGLYIVRALLQSGKTDVIGMLGACRAAGEFEDLQVVPNLIKLVDSKDQRLGNEAHRALMKLSDETFGKSASIWTKWWDELLKQAANPQWIVARSQNGNEKEKLTAVRLLATLKPNGAVQTLTSCTGAPEIRVRAAAVRGLMRIGAVDSLPLFIKLLKDEAVQVRERAHEALKFRTLQQFPLDAAVWEKWFQDARGTPALEATVKSTEVKSTFSGVRQIAARAANAKASSTPSAPAAAAPVASVEESEEGTPLTPAMVLPVRPPDRSGAIVYGLMITVFGAMSIYLLRETLRTRARKKAAALKAAGGGRAKQEALERLKVRAK